MSLNNLLKILVIGLFLISCSSKKELDIEHTAKNSLSWEGYYFGTVGDDNASYLRLYEDEGDILYELFTNQNLYSNGALWDDSGSVMYLNKLNSRVFIGEGYVELKDSNNIYILNKYDNFLANNKHIFIDYFKIKEIKDDNMHILSFPILINFIHSDNYKSIKGKINIDCSSKKYLISDTQYFDSYFASSKNVSKKYKNNKLLDYNISEVMKKVMNNYCLF